MKDLRVLFMGTPDFAVHILAQILQSSHHVVGVVTAPDKPAGRGQKMHTSAVKRYAETHHLPIYQPTNLKSDDFQDELQLLQPDIAVVVAFRMLPKKVWAFPKHGTFNLHASLLPDYRGAAPINWAIINGESQTGVTTFFLDEKIDTGKIIAQNTVPITPDDNAGTLHDDLMESGGTLVLKTLTQIAEGKVQARPQPTINIPKEAPKLNRVNTKIDWMAGLQEIYNFIRGLNPYPVAWTQFENGKKSLRCKIYEVDKEESNHNFTVGQVLKTKTTLKVAVNGGFITINTMQMPGKRKMEIKELLNGLQLKENAKMV